MTNIKKIITIIFIITIGILGYYWYRSRPIKPPDSKYTGAVISNTETFYSEDVNQLAELRDRTPVVTNEFEILFSYDTNSFTVNINQPYEENLNLFNNWLIDNNFNNIDKSKFYIKN